MTRRHRPGRYGTEPLPHKVPDEHPLVTADDPTSGTPLDVGGAVLCRVRLAGGGCTYSTRRTTLDDARAIRSCLVNDLTHALRAGLPVVEFPAADYEDPVVLVAARITSVEVVRVDHAMRALCDPRGAVAYVPTP